MKCLQRPSGPRTRGAFLAAAPRGHHPGFGIAYAAVDIAHSVAEVFQLSRTVTINDDVDLTSWTPTRDLHLLDLTGSWALRNGAAQSLAAARRPVCRAWSAAVQFTRHTLDGLWAPSTMTGEPMVVLYEHSADSFPAAPAFTRPLDAPLVGTLIRDAALRIAHRVG